MAQQRIHDQNAPSYPRLFNQKFDDIIGKFVLQGFGVVKGSKPMTVTVKAGKALLDGVEIIETEDLEDIITLDPAHDQYDRFDIIALKYLFGEVLPPPAAEIVVIKGTPSSNPQKPSLASDELELATIKVRAASSDIQNSDIRIPLKLRSRLHDLVYKGVTTKRTVLPVDVNIITWDTERDPRDLGLEVRHGDGWSPPGEDPPILRVYNAVTGEWVEKDHWDNIRGKPRLALSPHDLDGEDHIGKLRITRVSGHTRLNPVHASIRLEAWYYAMMRGAAITGATLLR